ncbi:MAG: trimeric intracellular cation channel family protein, partial [Rhodococcus sp. (in: high G+C Gram-positive bacteria)]
MTTQSTLLLVLDLLGTFAFAVNGAFTAVRVARIDIVGVVTLGMVTALGGGIIRDTLIDDLPPATFSDWRYLAVAAAGSLLALFGRKLERLSKPITVFDAAGLSLFAVTGAGKALDLGLGPVQAIILGAITGVGGGTVRDVLIRRVPVVLNSELYAIPALVAATV